MVAFRRSRALLAVAAVAACSALGGCAASTPPTAVRLTVSVFQYRSDYAPRQAQIEVDNRSGTDIEVTSARFESAWFQTAMSSKSAPSQVLGHATTDFPVVLSAAACSVNSAVPRVVIDYTAKDGTKGRTTVTPDVPFHSLATVHASDCSRQQFERVATIRAASALRFERVGGRQIALLDVTVTPTGAPGSVTLRSTEDTTLLAQREGQLRTFDTTFTAASAPQTIELDYTPTRCEQHVVAEDKVGTVVPIRVDAGTYRNALFGFAVSPAVKNELLDWVGRYCGW